MCMYMQMHMHMHGGGLPRSGSSWSSTQVFRSACPCIPAVAEGPASRKPATRAACACTRTNEGVRETHLSQEIHALLRHAKQAVRFSVRPGSPVKSSSIPILAPAQLLRDCLLRMIQHGHGDEASGLELTCEAQSGAANESERREVASCLSLSLVNHARPRHDLCDSCDLVFRPGYFL